MAEIFSFPFRLLPSGSVATVEQASDEGNAEQVAMLVLTRRGERHQVPAFGISDPTFDQVRVAEISAGLALFGPPVTVAGLTVAWRNDISAKVTLAFD